MFHPGWNELPRKFPGELSHPRPTNIRHEHGAMAKKMPQRFSKERLSYIYIYIYLYVPSKKNTSTFFSFPAFHCSSIPIFNHFEPELVAGLAGKASRAPETVTLNIPKETNGAEKDEQDPKDLVSRPEQ